MSARMEEQMQQQVGMPTPFWRSYVHFSMLPSKRRRLLGLE